MTTCPAVTIWPEIPPHGVRLACSLPEGHVGDHAAGEIEYLGDGRYTQSENANLEAAS